MQTLFSVGEGARKALLDRAVDPLFYGASIPASPMPLAQMMHLALPDCGARSILLACSSTITWRRCSGDGWRGSRMR